MIYRDTNNQVILIAEEEYSGSGDWFFVEKHFFDKNSKTFCFEKYTNYFGICSPEDSSKIIYETSIQYFDSNSREVGFELNKVDKNDNQLDTTKCYNPYQYKSVVKKNIEQVLKIIQ